MRTLLLVVATLLVSGCLNATDLAAKDDPNYGDGSEGAGDTTGGGANGTSRLAPVAVEVTVGDGPTPEQPSIYTLSPKRLELTVGQPVALTLKNTGRGQHDLVIPELRVAVEAIPGGSTSDPVTFTPEEAGTFEMFCTIGAGTPLNHKDNGMRGEVVVS